MIPASYAPREPPPDSTMPILGREPGGAFTHSIIDQRNSPWPPVVLGSMKLAVVAALLSSSTAGATTLEEFGSGVPLRPAADLYEASCDIDVDLRGSVATVEVRQKIVNGGTE